MSDELEHIRALRGDPPAPSDDWVSDTRAELLAMADDERSQRTAASTTATGSGWRARLAALLGGRRPAALAGAALVAVVAVVAVGAVVLTPDDRESGTPMAEPTSTSSTPAPATPMADPSPTPSASPADGVVLASSCEGGDGTYTIGYPEGWHTNTGEVAAPCGRFDEEPIELEAGIGGAPEQPVTVQVVPLPFDDATRPGAAFEEASRTTTTVDGRDAVVVQWTSTGAAALPEGMRSYRYLIDLDGQRTLLVAAADLGDGDFDDHRDVVDAMVTSLELTDA